MAPKLKANSHEKTDSKKTKPKSNTPSKPAVLPSPPIERDPYSPSKDAIWKDVIVRERKMMSWWCRTTADSKQNEVRQEASELGMVRVRPLFNPNDLYDTNDIITVVPKVRLAREQYGYYRKLKYLQEVEKGNTIDSDSDIPDIMASNAYVVNPLLC